MTKATFDKIAEGLQETLAIAKGEPMAPTVVVHDRKTVVVWGDENIAAMDPEGTA